MYGYFTFVDGVTVAASSGLGLSASPNRHRHVGNEELETGWYSFYREAVIP